MLFAISEAFSSIRDFMEAGGSVLWLIAILVFFMWAMIFERIWYRSYDSYDTNHSCFDASLHFLVHKVGISAGIGPHRSINTRYCTNAKRTTQSTVQQLNDQLQESFGRLEEEEDNSEEDEEGEEDEEEEEDGEDEEDQVRVSPNPDAALEEIDADAALEEIDEGEDEDILVENEIGTAIEELGKTESLPKKRGRKPKK